MKALILRNRVVQIEAEVFDVAPPLHWVECSDEITTEWTYENGSFVAPIPPPPPPTVIPEVVSMRQARLALLQVGLLSDVDAAIAQGTQADQITWEYATEVRRGDPLVLNLGPALGLSSSQLDSLFLLASTL